MRTVLMLGVISLAACTASTNGGVDIDPATDMIGDWRATLEPENETFIRGAAEARSAVATSGIALSIAGADSGAEHPWHIHNGTCGSGGSIVGDPDAYPVLRVGADGTASASADLLVGLDEDANYHVNVHQSPQALGTIVACGPLRP